MGGILIDDLQYFGFPSNDKVTCYDDSQLLYFLIWYFDEKGQVILELFDYLKMTWKFCDLLHRQ